MSPLQGDSFSMAGCMGMLLSDAVIYGILMWSVIVLYMFVFSLALVLS